MTNLRFSSNLTTSLTLFGIMVCFDYAIWAKDNGTIVKIGSNKAIPLVPLQVADGSEHWFILSLESTGLGLFTDTMAGRAFMSSINLDESRANALGQTECDAVVSLLGKKFSPGVVKFMELPKSNTELPNEQINSIAGILGFRIVPQNVAEFKISERIVILRDASVEPPPNNSCPLFNDSSGGYAVSLSIRNADWIFPLCSTNECTMSGALFATLLSSTGPHKNLGIPIRDSVSVSVDSKNSLSIFAIDSDVIVVDRLAMKVYFGDVVQRE